MNCTFDTYSLVKILEQANFNEKQAETLKWMFGMFFVFSSAQLGILMIILKSFFKGVGGV